MPLQPHSSLSFCRHNTNSQIQNGSLALLNSNGPTLALQQCKLLANTYRTKISDALALKLRPRAPLFEIDLFAFSNVNPEEPNMVITHKIILLTFII
jgi:hypothetical protein